MLAAVVTDTNRPPVYTAFPDPEVGPGQVEGTVLASAVHRVVRAVAAGQHYSHATAPPFVPGVDGVVRLADGRRVYTGLARPPWGMLAERVAIPAGFAIEVPAMVDDAVAAAIVNPAASSWIPLRRLLPAAGTVLVLGATGTSGLLAVQTARALALGDMPSAGAGKFPAAPETSTSMSPNASCAAASAAPVAWTSRTSAATPMDSAPSSRSRRTAASTLSCDRLITATRAPAAAKPSAMPRLIPLVPPATNTVAPV